MTRTPKVIALALAALLILAAALLGRRQESVVPGKSPKGNLLSLRSESASVDAPSAISLQLREAEAELLRLCEERDQLLRRKKDLDRGNAVPAATVEQDAVADEHYRQAERFYQAGTYDLAEGECRKALQSNPDHLPSRALLKELRFIAGRRSGTPTSPR